MAAELETTGALVALCTKAAEYYHRYLSENRRGTSETGVLALHILDEDCRTLSLRLARKLPDTDGIVLSLSARQLRQESPHHFTVKEYDAETGVLIVSFEMPSWEIVRGIKSHEIMVISDLLFLIARLREWYSAYGTDIRLPLHAPQDVSLPPFFPEALPLPEQRAAIETVLSKPLSYVWGAPGTGKTQTVLAYAIIAHLKAGHRVGVFAPTNNALEQVLRGVLPMIDKAGIDRATVVRVGIPSAAFAQDFPEVCGAAKSSGEAGELDVRIRELRKILATLPENYVPPASEQLSMFADAEAAPEGPQQSKQSLLVDLEQLRTRREALAGSSEFDRLHNATLVAATLDGFIGILHREQLCFDHVFIDEAGYASIARALPLFSLKAPITLSGDHCQLPPVCEVSEEDIRRDSSLHPLFVFSQPIVHVETALDSRPGKACRSWLEDLPQPYTLLAKANLTRSWRFGANLAAMLDRHVYRNGFAGIAEGTTHIRIVHALTPASQQNDPKTGKVMRRSTAEAEMIRRYVEEQGSTDSVILTPYVSQIRLLGDTLPQWWKDQRILTVHGSQGREWDEVIFSVADTDRPWFTDSLNARSRGINLINTAVSRAKRRLTIVCNCDFWKKQKGQLLADLVAAGEHWRSSR